MFVLFASCTYLDSHDSRALQLASSVYLATLIHCPQMVSTDTRLELLNQSIDLSDALENDDNILEQLTYPSQRLDFFVHLYEHRQNIEATTAYHLGISSSACQVSEVKEWRHGSFNVCIPIDISDGHYAEKRVLIRFPLPYKVGESRYPGNADEKLHCEIAAYLWINQNCPSVRIPKLLGFSFYNNRTVGCFRP